MLVPGLRPLVDRRVPQILGLYLGGSYAFVEFVAMMVDRYVWSPHLVTLALLVFALFIPTVLLLSWYHGSPGRDEWAPIEKVGIPTNFVVALVVLGLTFWGEDLGAATVTISVEDEDGNTVEAVVPKADFRRRLAIFYFDNESDDPESDWLSYGLSESLEIDLAQDLFVSTATGYGERLKRRGFDDARGAPVALQREIADESNRKHFLVGSFRSVDGTLEVETTLYETGSGKAVAERTFVDSDVFALIDSMSIQVKRDLEIPSGYLDDVQDLPVSQLVTESPDAFRNYVEAYRAIEIDRDFSAGLERLEEAVSLDPTFAWAQFHLARVYEQNNRGLEGEAAIQAAMDHVYRLPQKYQFNVKGFYYTRKQEPDKALAVAEMRVELYPDDIGGYLALSTQFSRRDRPDDALAMLERILEIDPSSVETLDAIGDLHKAERRFPEALDAYRRYADAFSDQMDPVREIAGLFQRTGQLDSAAAYLERAMLMDANDVSLVLGMAKIHLYRGDFGAADAGLADADELARTPNQAAQVGSARIQHRMFHGEIRPALETLGALHTGLAGVVPPAGIFFDSLALAVPLFSALGDTTAAFGYLARFAAQAQPPFDQMISLSYMDVYLVLEDADAIEELIPKAQDFIDAYGFEAGQYLVDLLTAEIRRWRGDCAGALPLYEDVLTANLGQEQEVSVRVLAGRCLRAEGDLDAAEAMVGQTLNQVPFHAEGLVELARIQNARGNQDQARTTLDRALSILENADAEYKVLREAQSLLARLGG